MFEIEGQCEYRKNQVILNLYIMQAVLVRDTTSVITSVSLIVNLNSLTYFKTPGALENHGSSGREYLCDEFTLGRQYWFEYKFMR